ncbi:MAG TPA: transglycosylase domain-containing protein [Spirillospora sp.]|nr:transglycosylase domain-containing protein [Spirillospora sp.]
MNRIRRLNRKLKLLMALAAVLLLGGGVWAYNWLFVDLPSVDELEAGLALPSTRIYDRNGLLLYEILPPEGGRNTAIALADVPAHCINAVIATEDANFYSHPGVDIEGVVRALWINVRGGEVLAGGSTITQQVARNLLLEPEQRAERTLQRKLRESILAIRLQNSYSKDDILTLYLNQTYFGNLAYGIEGAARAYFAKSAADLSLSECALLAGIIANPALYDPLSNLAGAAQRQENTLRLMVNQGYITQAEAEAARRDELQFAATRFPIEAPHFVMAVWTQLQRDYGDSLYHDGLDVVTTVDLNWTKAAEQIVRQQLDRLNHPPPGFRVPANANNAAVVAMDPFTGQVLTMLGSPDYFNEDIDGAVNAALALRQPGSALKPFTYAAAMNPNRPDPWTPATMILDVRTPFVTRRLESYTPANFGLVEHGPVLVREALASSYNIPAVVALENVGVTELVRLLANAGLTSLAENAQVDLAITLGGGEVRLLDMAQAYSIFPNGGYFVKPVFILKVTTRSGETLYQWQPFRLDQRVLDERVAYLITDILSDPNARIPAFGTNSALDIGRPAAAKTGTTTDFRDNWVMGYTPNLVVGVWVGNADNTPMVDVTGVSGAGPIWNQFIRHVLTGQPELTFTRPPGIVSQEVCALSGLLPTPECPRRRVEWFIDGTQPTEPDNLYQTFTIDRRTGLLADDQTPPEDRIERVYVVLPQEARDWAIRNGIPQPPAGAAVRRPDESQTLRLLQPDPYTTFQISPRTPPETQRIRLTVGAPPGTEAVTYFMNDQALGTVHEEPWALWWVLEPGDHELVAQALLADGTTTLSAPIPFRVTIYTPPQSRTVTEP